jgi:HAD superfamily hydrolase (TIGR01450 family)
MDLSAIRAFIFDLDGCVYAGNTLIPGVADVLGRLRAEGRAVRFLTNNSRESGEELLGKLTRLGITAAAEEILSGAGAAAPYLLERFGPSPVLTTGSATLRKLLRDAGHGLVDLEAYREASVVLVGHDFDFDYRRLTALSRAVAGGAAFVAVNLDARLPVEGGEFYPGCAAIVEAVAAAAGVRPEVIGKPESPLFRQALARLGVGPTQAVMVGDSLFSDIAGARRAGLRSIWLAPPDAPADPEPAPDLAIRAFAELLPLL